MNIMTIIILLVLIDELPELSESARQNRRAETEQHCIRRRNVARAVICDGITGHSRRAYTPDWDEEEETSWKVSHRWDTFYFKTRSFIDTGRVHNGDAHCKGKRAHKGQHATKLRARQLMADYEQYGE